MIKLKLMCCYLLSFFRSRIYIFYFAKKDIGYTIKKGFVEKFSGSDFIEMLGRKRYFKALEEMLKHYD